MPYIIMWVMVTWVYAYLKFVKLGLIFCGLTRMMLLYLNTLLMQWITDTQDNTEKIWNWSIYTRYQARIITSL